MEKKCKKKRLSGEALQIPVKRSEVKSKGEKEIQIHPFECRVQKNSILIATGGSTPLLCLQGVPDLPGAPQDKAGLMRKFET